jgi:hypothetical protein
LDFPPTLGMIPPHENISDVPNALPDACHRVAHHGNRLADQPTVLPGPVSPHMAHGLTCCVCGGFVPGRPAGNEPVLGLAIRTDESPAPTATIIPQKIARGAATQTNSPSPARRALYFQKKRLWPVPCAGQKERHSTQATGCKTHSLPNRRPVKDANSTLKLPQLTVRRPEDKEYTAAFSYACP